MTTVMFNIAIRPSHEDNISPHKPALYKIELHACDHCNHEQTNYLAVPGTVKHFETKEQMLEELINYTEKLWSRYEKYCK